MRARGRERERNLEKLKKNSFKKKTASCGTDKEGEYLRHLISTARTHLGDDVLFYTTDPPGVAQHGSLPGKEVLTLVDYGTMGFFSPLFPLRFPSSFFLLRFLLAEKEGKLASFSLFFPPAPPPKPLSPLPAGPGVDAAWAQSKADALNPPGSRAPLNSEFYSGWLTHWGELMANTSVPVMARSLEGILALPNRIVPFLVPQSAKAIAATTEAANLALIGAERGRAGSTGGVSLYMGAGGTNFGFQAGANLAGRAFEPALTSYDYDCPIGEDGESFFSVFVFGRRQEVEVGDFGNGKRSSLSSPFLRFLFPNRPHRPAGHRRRR